MDILKLEQELFDEISQLIEKGRRTISTQTNSTAILTFWHIGKRTWKALIWWFIRRRWAMTIRS